MAPPRPSHEVAQEPAADPYAQTQTAGEVEECDLASSIRSKLGAHLQAVRKSKGITQGELAGRADVTQATVSRMENGTRGDANTCARLLGVLGAPTPSITVEEPDQAAVRGFAKTMRRIAISALDSLDPHRVCKRLSEQLVDAEMFRAVRIWLVDEESNRATVAPGAEALSLASQSPLATAVETGIAQAAETDGVGLYFVPVLRGRRVLAVAEIEPRDPDDDIDVRIEAAAGMLGELALLLRLAGSGLDR